MNNVTHIDPRFNALMRVHDEFLKARMISRFDRIAEELAEIQQIHRELYNREHDGVRKLALQFTSTWYEMKGPAPASNGAPKTD